MDLEKSNMSSEKISNTNFFVSDESKLLEKILIDLVSIEIDGDFEKNINIIIGNLSKKKNQDVVKRTKDKLDELVKEYNLGGVQQELTKILTNCGNKQKGGVLPSFSRISRRRRFTNHAKKGSNVQLGIAKLMVLLLKHISTYSDSDSIFYKSVEMMACACFAITIVSMILNFYHLYNGDIDNEERTYTLLRRNLVVLLKNFCYMMGMYQENIVQGNTIITIPENSVTPIDEVPLTLRVFPDRIYNQDIYENRYNNELQGLLRRRKRLDDEYIFTVALCSYEDYTEMAELDESINNIRLDLHSLRHFENDTELIPIQYIDNNNITVPIEYDNVIATQIGDIRSNDLLVQISNDAKKTFKQMLYYCLFLKSNNTRTGGRTKSRTNKRKTNNKNKKRIARTKKSKRNSRSV
jgi:hypothetical protein